MKEQKDCHLQADAIKTCCHHNEEEVKNCVCKSTQRSEAEYKKLINRLNRIEGQVRGVKKMLDGDAYCVDILTQVAAINAALNSFNRVLLAEHVRNCVARDIRNGDDEVIEELINLLQKLMK